MQVISKLSRIREYSQAVSLQPQPIGVTALDAIGTRRT